MPIYIWFLSLLMAFVQFPLSFIFHYTFLNNEIMEMEESDFDSNCQRFIDFHQSPCLDISRSRPTPAQAPKTKSFKTFNKLSVKLIVSHKLLLTHPFSAWLHNWMKDIITSENACLTFPTVFTTLPCDIIKCL